LVQVVKGEVSSSRNESVRNSLDLNVDSPRRLFRGYIRIEPFSNPEMVVRSMDVVPTKALTESLTCTCSQRDLAEKLGAVKIWWKFVDEDARY
jgi:hypothetical protein